MYGNTIIGVVGPPYPYCSPVAFCAFAWLRHCAFGAFGASCCAFAWLRFCAFGAFGAKSFRKKKKTIKK